MLQHGKLSRSLIPRFKLSGEVKCRNLNPLLKKKMINCFCSHDGSHNSTKTNSPFCEYSKYFAERKEPKQD